MILDNFSLKTLDDFTLDKFALDNFRLDGAGSAGETIDHSTPAQVVNAAYDTSGNGGRKLVRLDNGHLICIMLSGTTMKAYKSTDNGATWSEIISRSITNLENVSITKMSTNYFVVLFVYNSNSALVTVYDSDGAVIQNTGVESGQNDMGTGSIMSDSSGNLYAAWASKNSTYPNSFNIRHAKSTDGGTTWTKADGTAGVDQITISNTAGYEYITPCIVIKSDNNPLVIHRYYSPGNGYYIYSISFNGSTWGSLVQIYNSESSTSYSQSNPSAVVSPDGHIHVAWQGLDVTDTAKYNIRYSVSTDNGTNWSAMEKLTSGNSVDRLTPSINADGSSMPYIVYNDNGTLKWIKDTGSWSSPETIATGTNPSTCEYTNFTKPMTLFMGASDVQFYGIWTES